MNRGNNFGKIFGRGKFRLRNNVRNNFIFDFKGGLALNINTVFLTQIVLTNIVKFINPEYILKYITRFTLTKYIKRLSLISQSNLNG